VGRCLTSIGKQKRVIFGIAPTCFANPFQIDRLIQDVQLELEGEVVFIFNELIFPPIVEIVVLP
jgi:hypothetical protein